MEFLLLIRQTVLKNILPVGMNITVNVSMIQVMVNGTILKNAIVMMDKFVIIMEILAIVIIGIYMRED